MIKTAMAAGANNDELLEGIMRTLDQQKMISYCSKDELSILSPAGRVLVAIMEDSSITQRALAVYLGVTESNIQKSIKALIDAGLVTKQKEKGRNTYRVNKERAYRHPDVSRFYDGIHQIGSAVSSDDESPF
jgi:predicted transcriptional regulator